ncbi:MAG: PQQ-dependent sugar dehydrogenase [Actinomycetota bacterium]|nr:PQQ-dependent sugar dehydrogenase [Actinomycetota bacterium]
MYLLYFSIFQDSYHIAIYLLGDIAFIPLEVLLVTLVVNELLSHREKVARLDKLNMVIGASSSDGLKMDSHVAIIDSTPSVKAAHQIQAVTVGPDKKLYVNVGDGMIDPEVAQDESDLRGKILRMELDGSVPPDNPIKGSYVFAKGFRNPLWGGFPKE